MWADKNVKCKLTVLQNVSWQYCKMRAESIAKCELTVLQNVSWQYCKMLAYSNAESELTVMLNASWQYCKMRADTIAKWKQLCSSSAVGLMLTASISRTSICKRNLSSLKVAIRKLIFCKLPQWFKLVWASLRQLDRDQLCWSGYGIAIPMDRIFFTCLSKWKTAKI